MSIFKRLRKYLVCTDCHWRMLAGHCRTCGNPLCIVCIDWPSPYLHSPGKGMCEACREASSHRHEEYFRLHPPTFQSGSVEPKDVLKKAR